MGWVSAMAPYGGFSSCAPASWDQSITQLGNLKINAPDLPGNSSVVMVLYAGKLDRPGHSVDEFRRNLDAQVAGAIFNGTMNWQYQTWSNQTAIHAVATGETTTGRGNITIRMTSTVVGQWSFTLTTTVIGDPNLESAVETRFIQLSHFAPP